MKLKLAVLCVFAIGLSGCQTKGAKPVESVVHSGTGTLLIKPIVFKKDAYIRDAVKQECNLDGKLAQFIDEYAASQYAQIITDGAKGPADAQVLEIEIESVMGAGGGAWSGAKDVVINGVLTQKGKKLGDFKGRRFSGGGMFGGYKGTCAILGRCVKTLGRDVSEWLRNPTDKGVLGDM